MTAIGLGFYTLHNTLQTNATQMTPQARGTAVAMFSSALYVGQTAGVRPGALVFDRAGAVPVLSSHGACAAGAGVLVRPRTAAADLKLASHVNLKFTA